MKNALVVITAAALLSGLPAGGLAQPASADPASERRTEDEIAAGVNAYRGRLGLPAIPRSPALDRVARVHAADLATHHPDRGTDARGLPCNAHSWSAHGSWRPVCYTADHHYAARMWDKPREITGGAYSGRGFEIAAMTTAPTIESAVAIASWQGSSDHNRVIAEQGPWANARWQAMGVGVRGGYAVVWFGKEPDRTGR